MRRTFVSFWNEVKITELHLLLDRTLRFAEKVEPWPPAAPQRPMQHYTFRFPSTSTFVLGGECPPSSLEVYGL